MGVRTWLGCMVLCTLDPLPVADVTLEAPDIPDGRCPVSREVVAADLLVLADDRARTGSNPRRGAGGGRVGQDVGAVPVRGAARHLVRVMRRGDGQGRRVIVAVRRGLRPGRRGGSGRALRDGHHGRPGVVRG
ncbi:hypothetical protein TCAP_00387 [Tolypocladium capitatum]|uniref:Secreted protein n=1 Tax=Tolypocladium capitatum TaxID=45235 RepID=A0A2K3QQ93_9HYPO|nr:hypothetical protein TCAP_00387 [Tolypocladium capitatum]